MDTILPPSGNGVLLPCDLWLVAGYAASTTIKRARVNAPSLLRVGYPSIRPVMRGTDGSPLADPNLMTLLDGPILLRSSEAVGVDALSNTAAEKLVALLWLADKLDPVPQGQAFSLRFTSSTAVSTGFVWSVIAPVYDQAIPSGIYAVIGLEFTSTKAIAARVVFPGSVFRPGVLGQVGSPAASSAGDARTHDIFYSGALGVWGTFQTNAPPNIEVLTSGAEASADMEGYLRVIRLGDIGAPPSPPGPVSSSTSGGPGAPTLGVSSGGYGTGMPSPSRSPYGGGGKP